MSAKRKLVSVIMPCYNAGSYLGPAIESILKQQYSNLELIIVNDGSTDDSEQVIKSYSDSRIRYFKQDNKGQCAASNFGLSKAIGDYIKFFDADDVLNEEHLLAQLNRLNGHEDILSSCAWGRFYGDNPNDAIFIPEKTWKDLPALEWIKAALTQQYDMMGAPLWLIPRSVISKAGGWDERLSLNNDFEFSMRLLMHVKEVRFATDAKLYYRTGKVSLSGSISEKAYRSALLTTDLGCSYLLKMENTLVTRQLCADRYKEWLFRIYPEYPDLQNELEERIQQLGGSSRIMDGGKLFQLLCLIVGWRNAKKLKIKLRTLGYQRLPWN